MKSGDLVRIKRYVINRGGQSAGFPRTKADYRGVFAHVRAVTLLDRIGIVLRETGKDCVVGYEDVNCDNTLLFYNVAFGEDIIVSHEDYLEKIIKD